MPELSPYQVEGVTYLCDRERTGLYDVMGTGKTAQALMALDKGGLLHQPAVVTAPAYLLDNWRQEIAKWLPGARVGIAQGERPERQKVLESNADIILASYNMWHSYPLLQKRKWSTLVYDESHRLRGRNSQWTKKVQQLLNVDSPNRGTRMWLLTGTPIVRDAGDIWTHLNLYDRQLFKSYWRFVERYCEITYTPWSTEVGGVKDPDEFSALLRRYSLRRTAEEIPELRDLEYVEKDVWVNLPTSVRQAVLKARKEYFLEHPDLDTPEAFESGGAMIQRLLQLVSDPPTQANPKLDTLSEFMREDAPYERIVVFCWYRNTAQRILERVQRLKRPVALITGDRSTTQRLEAIKLYNEKPNTVLIGTIAAMKEGLNLQAGRNVCFVEESDLPEDNAQAIGRVLRRGQTEKVQVHRFLTVGWPEQSKHTNILTRGRNNARALLEEVRHSS